MPSTALCLALFVPFVWCRTVTWTNLIGNSVWGDNRNWSPTYLPAPGDTVIINNSSSSSILVDVNVNIGQCQLLDGVLSVPRKFVVTGAFQIAGNARLDINSGENIVSTAAGNVTSKQGIRFNSGLLSGSWTIHQGSLLNFSTAGQKAFNGAKVQCDGTAAGMSGATFSFKNASVITFSNPLSLASTSEHPSVTMLGDDDSSVGGKVSVTASSQLIVQVPTVFTDVDIASGASVQMVTAKHSWGTVSALEQSTISILGGATLNITSLSTKGEVSSANNVKVIKGVTINTLALRGGKFQLAAGGTITSLFFYGGSLVSQGLTATTVDVRQVGTMGGSGTFSISSLTVGGNQAVISGPDVIVSSKADFSGQLLIASGSLTISKGATATATALQMVPQGGRGNNTIFTNNGQFAANGAVTFTQINGAGAGSFTTSKGTTFKVQDSNFAASMVTLAPGSSLLGATTVWNLGGLNTTGSISLTVDKVTVDCATTCGKISGNTPEVYFNAVAA